MMLTAREEAETCIRRAMVWSIPLHSVCILVAAKNLELYPLGRTGALESFAAKADFQTFGTEKVTNSKMD